MKYIGVKYDHTLLPGEIHLKNNNNKLMLQNKQLKQTFWEVEKEGQLSTTTVVSFCYKPNRLISLSKLHECRCL